MKKYTSSFYLVSVLILLCVKINTILAQDTTRYITFMGFVYDENNKPIPGAVLQNQTRNKAVATELNGRFLMVLAPGDEIKISYIGFRGIKFNIPTTITDNKFVKNIVLKTDTVMLNGPTVRAYPTAEEMFTSEINIREVGPNAGFISMDHAPIIKAPNPLTSPLSAISNAVQKRKMKNGKGSIDPYHQSMMIKDFYKDGATAVPDSVMNLYNH